MYARGIAMSKNSNSGSDLATYIASNTEPLTEQNEYSCAAEPPVQGGVSHLSGRNEPLYRGCRE